MKEKINARNVYISIAILLMLAVVVYASGCIGQINSSLRDDVPSGAKIVEITSNGFNPAELRINVGDTVAFVNKDTVNHWPATAMHPTHIVYPGSNINKCGTSEQKNIFDACASMETGKVFAFTFKEKGEWRYHDHINCCADSRFFGKIIIE